MSTCVCTHNTQTHTLTHTHTHTHSLTRTHTQTHTHTCLHTPCSMTSLQCPHTGCAKKHIWHSAKMSNHEETIIYNNKINSAVDEGVISSTDRQAEPRAHCPRLHPSPHPYPLLTWLADWALPSARPCVWQQRWFRCLYLTTVWFPCEAHGLPSARQRTLSDFEMFR